jgi:hypothetical protein
MAAAMVAATAAAMVAATAVATAAAEGAVAREHTACIGASLAGSDA